MPTDSLRDQLQLTLGTAYTLTRELGGGGMSRVFVARDAALERDVGVKVLSPDLAAGVSAERFTREIKLAASLQQANIVPLLSAGATDGLPYYTMPFIDGLSLPVGEAISVPRDIMPENILLSGDAAVVTDFGIAKALGMSVTVHSMRDNQCTVTELTSALSPNFRHRSSPVHCQRMSCHRMSSRS